MRVATGCALSLAVLGPAGPAGVVAQVSPPPPPGRGPVVVVPADHCRASRAFAALAGRGYRELWTTPVRVPVADLDRLGGGLTPLRVGGGVTTRTLHVQGTDGRRYVFRSVQKTTRQALAEEFWGTPVEAIMRDQLCSFHPSGAVIVARLLDAVGVLHTEPQYLVIPDDPRLGEFREQFAGMLALFEERPDERPDRAGFAGSDRVVQIENLFDDLESDPAERIDAAELLRSRLIDILVGDRDRSINNHLWARFVRPGGGHLWRPIPRDRDQAFVRFDGAVKTLGRHYDNRLVSFGDEYPDMEGLTRNAWDIDRNLLVGLERAAWDRTVAGVKDAIPDEVLAEAVRRMPPEHYAVAGVAIETGLRSRRDNLARAAEELYRIVFRYADVRATDADEVALVQGLEDGRTRVSLYRRTTGATRTGAAHFDRTFSPVETREIRIYLQGGDDRIEVEGSRDSGILVRAVGGGGRDELVNAAGRRVVFYDGGDDTTVEGSGVELVRRNVPRIYSWWVDGEGELDWGTESYPEPGLGYDADRGLVVGLGVRHDRYGFLRRPFSSRIVASLGWAVGRSQPIADYRHEFQDRIGGWDIGLRGRYSGVEIVRWYGPGNETVERNDERFYRVHQKQLVLGTELSLGDRRHRLSIGPEFRYTDSDTSDAATFIAESRPYGTGTFSQAGLRLSLSLDRRDVAAAPKGGYRIAGGAAYWFEGLDVASPFGEVHGEAALYVSPPSGNPTLALRAGGRKLWGVYPYSDAAYIGGAANVRGLREQRFAGDGAAYGNAELRAFLTRFLLLFPVDFGVFGLTDVGRVFVDGESSGAWHGAWGGGLWFAPLYREATIHVSLARHRARSSLHVGMGFAF